MKDLKCEQCDSDDLYWSKTPEKTYLNHHIPPRLIITCGNCGYRVFYHRASEEWT
tara:strand:- start:40898 stop:41062 length:165 start_codon:yes stop_codon:yes gene_type:complete